MRKAPAVSIDLAAAAPWRIAFCAIAAASAGASVIVILQHLQVPASSLGAFFALAAGASALGGWRYSPFAQGRLRFDGERWWFRPGGRDDAPGLLHVMIDFGDRMLLRFDPDPFGSPVADGRAWLPVGNLPADNASALRAAVYCRRLKPQPPPAGENPTR